MAKAKRNKETILAEIGTALEAVMVVDVQMSRASEKLNTLQAELRELIANEQGGK